MVPVVIQSPVNLRTLIPIPGFLGSPHNLNEILFDIESYKGSFSQVSSIEVYPVGVQSKQSKQVSQTAQLGVQTGTMWSQVGNGLGVGVGVGVGGIIVTQG